MCRFFTLVLRVIVAIPRFLCFALLCCTDTFFKIIINWRCVATLHWANLSVLFSNSVRSLHVSATFRYFSQHFKPSPCYSMCYGDLWPVISDTTIVTVLGHHESCPHEAMNLIHKCCVFWLLWWPAISCLCHSDSLRHNNIEIVITLQGSRVCKGSSERKNCTSLTLNQRLERIKFNEEGLLKTKTRPLEPSS